MSIFENIVHHLNERLSLMKKIILLSSVLQLISLFFGVSRTFSQVLGVSRFRPLEKAYLSPNPMDNHQLSVLRANKAEARRCTDGYVHSQPSDHSKRNGFRLPISKPQPKRALRRNRHTKKSRRDEIKARNMMEIDGIPSQPSTM